MLYTGTSPGADAPGWLTGSSSPPGDPGGAGKVSGPDMVLISSSNIIHTLAIVGAMVIFEKI
jgi:hypothetical protein